MSYSWKIWIDTGGAFTDCLAFDHQKKPQKIKILSSGKLRGIIRSTFGKTLRVTVSWPVLDNIFNGYHMRIDGILRLIRFMEDITFSLLSQHRIEPTNSMEGGLSGEPGAQFLIGANGGKVKLMGIETIELKKKMM